MVEGLKHALKTPSFVRFLVIVFVGMGIFNGVTTWVEGIVRPRGIGLDQAGILGAIMLVGGIIGAMVIPHFSDKAAKRKPYIVLGLIGAIPGLVGLALAPGFVLIAASSFVLGFFLIAVNPVGMQYAAEVAHPTPEGTPNLRSTSLCDGSYKQCNWNFHCIAHHRSGAIGWFSYSRHKSQRE